MLHTSKTQDACGLFHPDMLRSPRCAFRSIFVHVVFSALAPKPCCQFVQHPTSCLANLICNSTTVLSTKGVVVVGGGNLYRGSDHTRTRESVPADSHDSPSGVGSSAVTRPSCATAADGAATTCRSAPPTASSSAAGLHARPCKSRRHRNAHASFPCTEHNYNVEQASSAHPTPVSIRMV